LFRQAADLTEGLLVIHGQPTPPLDAAGRSRLEQAVKLFEQVLEMNPGNWAAIWLLGKIFQRLENFSTGFDAFALGGRTNPDPPDIAGEAWIAALELGRPEQAATFCQRAVIIAPNDAGLHANLALAHLLSGQPEQARESIVEAKRLDPSDPITVRIERNISD